MNKFFLLIKKDNLYQSKISILIGLIFGFVFLLLFHIIAKKILNLR